MVWDSSVSKAEPHNTDLIPRCLRHSHSTGFRSPSNLIRNRSDVGISRISGRDLGSGVARDPRVHALLSRKAAAISNSQPRQWISAIESQYSEAWPRV